MTLQYKLDGRCTVRSADLLASFERFKLNKFFLSDFVISFFLRKKELDILGTLK